tara:strand:+ start:10710 stop:11000 length:291 start_codon:yes stop_codon:yes gene_type:complete
MIKVGKRWDNGAEYVGRGSPLGNPFVMKNESERNTVCAQYDGWFHAKVRNNDPIIMAELIRLDKIHKSTGNLILGCYCAPKLCHGETIKSFLGLCA